MKDIKDIFSKQSADYVSSRPTYPDTLYEYLYSHVENFDAAWDCGTGNGQVASRLADRFAQVYGTDISDAQMGVAVQKENIIYSNQRAESTNFADNTFDLLTVGTAVHWFDFPVFYDEVKRVCKDGALIAVWAYDNIEVNEEVNKVLMDYHFGTVGAYWEDERKFGDDRYDSIPFPFDELPKQSFDIEMAWSYERLMGYLTSWSATQKYIRLNGSDPLDILRPKLEPLWKPGEVKTVLFNVFMRNGYVRKGSESLPRPKGSHRFS